jgi:hypothetical protein
MWRTGVLISAGAATVLSGCGSGATSTSDQRHVTPLVPNGALVAGRSYTEWGLADARWREGLPTTTAAPRGECITSGQSSPVWLLDGDEERGKSITRRCTVPRGDFIVSRGPGWACSTTEFRKPTSDAELERCARRDWAHKPPAYRVTFDGVLIQPPGLLLVTPQYTVLLPPRDTLVHDHGNRHSREVTYGYVMILRPLTPGHHTLVQYQKYPHQLAQTITNDINVG